MSKILVPSAPVSQLSAPTKENSETRTPAPKAQSPLDAAFLGRIYRSMLWVGLVATALTIVSARDAAIVASLMAGMALAATLLRAQEIGVRALMRPAEQMMGMDARLFLVLLLPLKFILIVAVLGTLSYFHLILPAYMALGFFIAQLVIVCKVAGWMMARPATN